MTRIFVFATLVLTGTLLAAGSVRATEQTAVAATVKKARPAERINADQAYKANCTRCHAELPKLEPRGMKTVLMHMRVRGNIPEDEARAILAYLTR